VLRSSGFCCEEGYDFRDDVGGGDNSTHGGMLRHTVCPFSLKDRQTDIQTRVLLFGNRDSLWYFGLHRVIL
jgi:hypothetical protein